MQDPREKKDVVERGRGRGQGQMMYQICYCTYIAIYVTLHAC